MKSHAMTMNLKVLNYTIMGGGRRRKEEEPYTPLHQTGDQYPLSMKKVMGILKQQVSISKNWQALK